MNNYKQEFIETLPEKDKKYYSKEYSYVLKIDNKYYLPIEKSRLKKDFCFGYGQNGISTDEEYEIARDNANYADTSEKYFIEKNLEEINRRIAQLKYFFMDFGKDWQAESEYRYKYNIDFTDKVYLLDTYNHKYIQYMILDDEKKQYYQLIIREATKEEIQAILVALEEEKKDFTKRLNTYLKKYGTSKVRTWTYLRD